MSGKGKAPLPSKDKVPIFDLDLEDLTSSYGKLLARILRKIRNELQHEIMNQPALYKMPDNVNGKTYTPQGGVFLVRMTLDGVVVYLLYRWIDLYFMGWHAKGVWYLFDGIDKEDLPLPGQVFYQVKNDRGIKKLNITSSYKNIGGPNIYVSKDMFNRCHRSLNTADELLETGHGLEILMSGPLALPVVGISEALRFVRFKGWMQSAISLGPPFLVPKRYSDHFTYYSQLCKAYINGEAFGDFTLPMLDAMLGVLLRTGIQPVLLKWGGSASTSKSELIQIAMEEEKNKRLSAIVHAPRTNNDISKDDAKEFKVVPSEPAAEFRNAARLYDTFDAGAASGLLGKATGAIAPSTPAPAAKYGKDNEQLHCKASTEKNESVKPPVLINVKPWSDTIWMEKALEAHLYISGDEISKDDIRVFAAVPSKPGPKFPNAARWYDSVAAATDLRFPGKATGVCLSSAPVAQSAMDVDDDDGCLDLFGDESEEDKKAAADLAAAKRIKKKEISYPTGLIDREKEDAGWSATAAHRSTTNAAGAPPAHPPATTNAAGAPPARPPDQHRHVGLAARRTSMDTWPWPPAGPARTQP